MELQRVILCCSLVAILVLDVIVASPIRASDIAEAERLELAIEEGLAVYRAERRKQRRHRRRTNLLIEAIRMCRNYRHYPVDRIPELCRDYFYRAGAHRTDDNSPTIVIIEK